MQLLLLVQSGLRSVAGTDHRAVIFEIAQRTRGLLKSGDDKLIVHTDTEIIVWLNIGGVSDEA